MCSGVCVCVSRKGEGAVVVKNVYKTYKKGGANSWNLQNHAREEGDQKLPDLSVYTSWITPMSD